MKIEHLEYFTMLDGVESFSQAAERAHISQQGFGKVISSMEKTLGCTLVHRNAKGASLTDEGDLLMRHAKKIVAEYDLAVKNLQTQRSDIEVLREFRGDIAFSNVCIISFDPLLSGLGILEHAGRSEFPLDEALAKADDPSWLCISDVCTQIYTDYLNRWDIVPLAVGRVGIIVKKSMLRSEYQNMAAREVANLIPLGLFDCYATREIYEALFGKKSFGEVRMRTTSDKLLQKGLMQGDFAVLSDTFQWDEMDPANKVGPDGLMFMPFEPEMTSIFGFVRKKGLPYSPQQQAAVDSFKRTFNYIRRAKISG